MERGTVRKELTVLPADRVLLLQLPVPVSFTVCGLPPPLSPIESEAVRLPFARGVKVTLIEHDFPPPRLDPQVLVSEKSPAFTPVIPILVMLSKLELVLVTVTDLAALF